MAIANVENDKRACGFAAQAVQRAQGVPERERLWVDSIAHYYQIDDAARAELQSGNADRIKAARAALDKKNEQRDQKHLARQLVRDLEAVVAACPKDIEAKAYLAVQIWRNTEYGIEITSHGAVDALLDQVFAALPLHPAHHFRIHLWDGEKPERALASAALNGASAPAIAHQWHMSGHIYADLNRHAEAAWQQEASGRADHVNMLRDRVMPFEIHNYGHNQEWLCRSLSYVGRVREALELAKNMVELPRHPKLNRIENGREIAGYARQRLLTLCEDHDLWEEALELARRGFLEPCDDARSEAARLVLQGRALYRLGRGEEAGRLGVEAEALLVKARVQRGKAIDTAESEAQKKQFDEGKVHEAIGAAARNATDPVRRVQDVQRELVGEKLLAAGDAKGALVEFTASHSMPKTLLAEAHLAAGDAVKAVEILEQECKAHPGRVAPLARLVLALEAAGRRDDAAAKFGEVRRLAGHADLDTPLLARLGSLAQALGVPADWRQPQPFGADFGERPPLESLGPFRWSPAPAPGFDLLANGGRATLASHRGHPVLVVFYLGSGCVHCVEQLQALAPRVADFAQSGIDIVAIGSEPQGRAAAARQLGSLPFPLLADPELAVFKAWRCYDDFERMPLHGTFLVDGDGKTRWQDIAAEPFTQVDWLLAESRRLLALPAGAGAK